VNIERIIGCQPRTKGAKTAFFDFESSMPGGVGAHDSGVRPLFRLIRQVCVSGLKSLVLSPSNSTGIQGCAQSGVRNDEHNHATPALDRA